MRRNKNQFAAQNSWSEKNYFINDTILCHISWACERLFSALQPHLYGNDASGKKRPYSGCLLSLLSVAAGAASLEVIGFR